MALPMKKSVMKSTMKSMKATAMKARVMKKKAVSKIARGKLAKVVVFKGNKEGSVSKTNLVIKKQLFKVAALATLQLCFLCFYILSHFSKSVLFSVMCGTCIFD